MSITQKRAELLYFPRIWQKDFHARKKRHNCLVIHRRGGKSVACVNDIIDEAYRFDKMDPLSGRPLMNPQYAYVATTIGQVEKIAWQYFKFFGQHIPDVKFNEKKLRLTFPHPTRGIVTVYLMGAENFDAHRGIYLDGYVLDEFGDMHPDVRDKVFLPTISDRNGWEVIIGTPKGDNQFKKLHDHAKENEAWLCILAKASETGILPESELKMLRATMSYEAYQQEYECDWDIAPEGYYYSALMDDVDRSGRVCHFQYDPMYRVKTFWDLGVNDTTAIWFIQEVGREVRVLNYWEGHGKGLDYWCKEVLSMPYNYIGHVFPHDLKAREMTSGRSRMEFVHEQGLRNIEIMPKCNDKAEGIHQVRQVLPICIFHDDNTELGRQALREYKKKYDSKLRQYLNTPLHNWASNGADAFRCFAMHYYSGFGGVSTEDDIRNAVKVVKSWDVHQNSNRRTLVRRF